MDVVVRLDRQGRIVIPASIRKNFKTNMFIAKIVDGEIHLKPVETLSLTSLVDSIEVDVKDFTDTHELRKAVVEK